VTGSRTTVPAVRVFRPAERKTEVVKRFLPIVVAAPGKARTRLRYSDALPQHLLRDIEKEPLWEEQSDPGIYLWPFDISYPESDALLAKAQERVADVPAFFGMDTRVVEKDHQERMLVRFLFDSVVVHILFLNNEATDTTPGTRERNETYAEFGATFKDIIRWSENLKKVVNIRFPKKKPNAQHILVLIACEEQVKASSEDIKRLEGLIGKNKVFTACYFLDYNLQLGSGLYHSEYLWDVTVGRFLCALMLSQEDNGDLRKPLWENGGVKVWRASTCTISVPPASSQEVRRSLGDAVQRLRELVGQDEEMAEFKLMRDVVVPRRFTEEPEPCWHLPAPDPKAWEFRGIPLSILVHRNWSGLRASEYCSEVSSPAHWEEAFGKLRSARVGWSKSKEHRPKDYTTDVRDCFTTVHYQPGAVKRFVDEFDSKRKAVHDFLKKDHSGDWKKISDEEEARRRLLRELEEDTREFEKAQAHYIGLGTTALIMGSTTLFAALMLWHLYLFQLFGVGFSTIVQLSGMVFLGSAAACLLLMMLHNRAGNNAAGKIMEKCVAADGIMRRRNKLVRDMFFDSVGKRDTLALQCVRFRTNRLMQRVLFILEKELAARLSSLLEPDEKNVSPPNPEDYPDPDLVRENYLRLTRTEMGPLSINDTSCEAGYIEGYVKGRPADGKESFFDLWKRLCLEDGNQAGYFPAAMFISQIRGFIVRFLGETHHQIFRRSIRNGGEDLRKAFKQYTENVHRLPEGPLLSASLSSYFGTQRRILFISSSFFDFRFKGSDGKKEPMREYESQLLETTHTAALYYQEFDVSFELGDSDVLTFRPAARTADEGKA